MNDPKPQKTFADAAGEKESTLVGDMISLLRHNKKWWLIPLLAVLLAFGLLLILGATGAAPFIYTLF